ncbi:response regulator transcription factor [Bacillus sp. NP157]|nr:response regulator transcription factor [Bacillus sp. NP157]
MTTSQRIRILIADDHPIFRAGIEAILSVQDDMELVGAAGSGEEAVAMFRALRPDLVLMDLQMPGMGGLNAIRALRREFPEAKVVVLTTYQGDMQICNALKAGAASYLIKSTLRNDLIYAIQQVHAGGRPIPVDVAKVLEHHDGEESLSPREIEVLGHVALGFSNKRIANQMGISIETVKTHMKNILLKVKAKDRAEAVVTALKRGILED